MSVVTAQANPNFAFVVRVREGCERLDGDIGRCINWIFDRLVQITMDHPDWDYRRAWYAMKGRKSWQKAGFALDIWQRASSYVSSAFDRNFQAPPKHRDARQNRGARRGRRLYRGIRGLAYAH